MSGVNINQFRNKVNEALDKLTSKLPELGAAEALNATTLIRRRIQRTGKKADGNQLGQYSEAYKKRKKPFASTYNPNLSFVDLTLKSRMWNNIGLQQTDLTGDKVLVKVGTSNTEDEAKLVYNTIRYGEVLNMSKEEQQAIGESLVNEVSTFFKNEFSK